MNKILLTIIKVCVMLAMIVFLVTLGQEVSIFLLLIIYFCVKINKFINTINNK